MDPLRTILLVVGVVLVVYHSRYDLAFLGIILRAAVDIARETRWPRQVGFAEVLAALKTPGVGIIVPVHHEVAGITEIRKAGIGRRGDAVNAGLRAADQDLVCMIDADSLLEPDALLHVIEPFLLDSNVVGVGVVVRPANGATVDRGIVTEIRAPHKWIERIQVLEYLPAFLVGRTGWSGLDGLVIISGAFGVFRRTAITALGGPDPAALAEDADLVLAIRRRYRDRRIPVRLVFVPTPACRTEVPTVRSLARQRTRWYQGLGELLHKYRGMIGNPRYGVLGAATMPCFLLFKLLRPILGGPGIATMLLAALTGITPWPLLRLTIAASIGLGFINSAVTVLLGEVAHRFARPDDALKIRAAGIVEPLWFHAFHTWWRTRGLIRALSGHRSEGGTQQQRSGFEKAMTQQATVSRVPEESTSS